MGGSHPIGEEDAAMDAEDSQASEDQAQEVTAGYRFSAPTPTAVEDQERAVPAEAQAEPSPTSLFTAPTAELLAARETTVPETQPMAPPSPTEVASEERWGNWKATPKATPPVVPVPLVRKRDPSEESRGPEIEAAGSGDTYSVAHWERMLRNPRIQYFLNF